MPAEPFGGGLGAGAAFGGLGPGLFLGRTRGSAALGRRILITGGPFEPAKF